MPLGAIHLIVSEADRNHDAVFFCGIKDAIAAILPVRIPRFPKTEICAACLSAYDESENRSEEEGTVQS